MKFEVNKRNLSRKSIFIGIIVLTIIVLVLLFNKSFAKYSSVKTIHLVNSTVNYTKGDFSIVAMYKNDGSGDTEITTMPSAENYTINESKSYCTINGTKDNNAVLKTIDGHHTFENLQKGSKCYLYFDKKLIGTDLILANQGGGRGKYNDSDSFTEVSTASDTGIYETEDDYGTSYYFRGDSDKLNNWVRFAGYYWRIIRVNGNGSIRMIYSGVADGLPNESNKTGETTQIGSSVYNNVRDASNSYNPDNAYVGYMYGTTGSSSYNETHNNINNSTIKTIIDSWYRTNLLSYSSKLDTETGFCNDREISSGTYGYSGNGAGTRETAYAPVGRLYTKSSPKASQTPTLKCTNKDRDLFTVTGASIGNKKLTYPIGLITSDEVVYAGGFALKDNTEYYLYTNKVYWTMSPVSFSGKDTLSSMYVYVFYVSYNGWPYPGGGSYNVASGEGVRPVINLLPTAIKSGDGSVTNPYLT